MKTTIDIPPDMLREAQRHTGAKTKRAAVVAALEDFNRRRRLQRLAARLHGACPGFLSRRELLARRRERKWGAAA